MKNNPFVKTRRTDPLTGVVIETFRHPCGLILHRIPKPKFSKKFAGILVPYGAIHTAFETPDGPAAVPAGSAHYLEHCVFSRDEEGGLLGRLSALGAGANAYTSHTHTMYYFTTVDHFAEAFDLYLGAVLHPYLEQDRVEAERSIILQELDMYQDDPENQCFANLLESLYVSHPVRVDIGGTRETVPEITPAHLKMVRDCFYSPDALTVTVSGDVGEEEILSIVSRQLDACALPARRRPSFSWPQEPEGVLRHSSESAMDVSEESFLVGMKNPSVLPSAPLSGWERVFRQKSGQLFLEMILGCSSDLFESLYSEGLVNESFSFQYVCEETFSYVVMGGESPDPKTAVERLCGGIKAAFLSADKASFERQKRVEAGDFIRSQDSVEHCGMAAAVAELSGINLFDYPEIYDKIDLDDAAQAMRFVCDPQQTVRSFILKKTE